MNFKVKKICTNILIGIIISQMLTFMVDGDVVAAENYEHLMQCYINGDALHVRTSFDDKNDLLQKFFGVNKVGYDKNYPFDFGQSGLVSKNADITKASYSTVFSFGVDEATPFKINDSYIGANHGQSHAVLVTAKAHGKTYADIGSLWLDAVSGEWNLLKVVDENTLMFLSELYRGDIGKYTFRHAMRPGTDGTTALIHKEGAKNTTTIKADSVLNYQQLFPSIKKLEKDVYAIINGNRQKVADGVITDCDYVEVVEKYQIINPSTVGAALRAARPEGGYTEAQDLAVGSPLINYNMIYRILPDGTVLSIFDHEILENVKFEFYGGLQYVIRNDAFGGGIHRYIPKLKPVMHSNVEYNYTEPVNMATLNYTSSVQLTSDLWDSEKAPDRQIDYYKDSTSNVRASFVGGYLPILDGEPTKRSQNINASGFLYKSKKTYPYFVDSKTFETNGTKNQRIQGVAYKKYNGAAENDISYYTIPYGQDTYIYIDCHELLSKELDFTSLIKDGSVVTEIEKSSNITYSQNRGKLRVEMENGTYGYLVLCVKKTIAEPVSLTKNVDSGKVVAKLKNNTHEKQDPYVIIAAFADEQLVEVKAEKITLNDSQIYNYETVLDGKKTFNKVKVLLWDSLSSLTPISPLIEG